MNRNKKTRQQNVVIQRKTRMSKSGWFKAAKIEDIPVNGGACVKVQDKQIALFYLQNKDELYACQNLCTHKKQMILSRGIVGDKKGEPMITCPLHKKSFSLKTGNNLNNEDYRIRIYSVKLEDGFVYIELPILENKLVEYCCT